MGREREIRVWFAVWLWFVTVFSGSLLGNSLPVPLVSRKSKGRNLGVTDVYGNVINFSQQRASYLECSREGLPCWPKKHTEKNCYSSGMLENTVLRPSFVVNDSSFRTINYVLTSLPVSLWHQKHPALRQLVLHLVSLPRWAADPPWQLRGVGCGQGSWEVGLGCCLSSLTHSITHHRFVGHFFHSSLSFPLDF